MKKKQRLQKRVQIKQELEEFSNKFIEYASKLLVSFEKVQPKIRDSVPPILNSKNIKINSYFSEDRNHVMILFEEDINNNFSFTTTKGNILDAIHGASAWLNSNPAIIRFQGGILNSCSFLGVKPDVFGDKAKVTLSDVRYATNSEEKLISYGYIFSYSVFKEISNDLENYIQNIIYSFWDYYRNNKERLDSNEKLKKGNEHIKDLLEKMKELFFNEQIDEAQLDNFITNNPIILERCLDIKPDSLLPQMTLTNWVQENFEQDIKPDLICQNIHNDWVILDYKRAKRITKKIGTARADVIAEVHELKTQLTTYRKYFNEEKHRNSFFKKTGLRIGTGPDCIGIIGNVSEEERKTFKNAIEDSPHWIQIVPYNDIFTKFENYYYSL